MKPNLSFEQKMANYAALVIEVGVGLKEGQRLLIQSPVVAAELARALTKAAYEKGARFVDVRWDDDEIQRLRYEMAPEGTFEEFSRWRVDAEIENADAGGAVLAIRATNPQSLVNADPARVSTHMKVVSAYRQPYTRRTMSNQVQWNLIAAPVEGWSELIFPDHDSEEAAKAHWEAIFAATRADTENPIEAWKTHLSLLKKRHQRLSAAAYDALHFSDPATGTDLTVGLADGHLWGGGSSSAPDGTAFTPNIPTEEVWTAPHRERVNGVARSTKPLSLNGQVVDGISMRFEGGKVVEFSAEKGESALKQLLDTDEGARRLGEVALVPHSSPISTSGLFHFHTLYDENAASHIALGAAYRFNLEGGSDLDNEAMKARGANVSLVHVDWMIGSAGMKVEGIAKDGGRTLLMENGEFVGELSPEALLS